MSDFEVIIKGRPLDAANNLADVLTGPARESLLAWVALYWRFEVDGSPGGTLAAKKTDIEQFLSYFSEKAAADSVDEWTKPVSKHFRTWLETVAKNGDGYAPASINRKLATLKHMARWIHKHREFLAGNPMEDVRDLGTGALTANSLTDIEMMRLRSAFEQHLRIKSRANQRPYRNRAIFEVFYGTGLRTSELCRLDFGDYREKRFHGVRRKGNMVTEKVFVPPTARNALDQYFEVERGREAGPMWLTKSGKRVTRQDVDRLLRDVAAFANQKLPEGQKIKLHAHRMRHTSLTKACREKGIDFAQELSGNVGKQHVWRYVQYTEEEKAAAADEVFG